MKYREYTHPSFWFEDVFYCFITRFDAHKFVDPPTQYFDNPPELWISTKPADDETVLMEALCEHDILVDDSDECIVVNRHEHLIHLFVTWKAWQNLAMNWGMDPNPTDLTATTMAPNAMRAERTYLQALKDAQQADSDTGQAHLWMDKFDRNY